MTELDKKMKRLRVLLVDDSSERRASVEDSLSEVECEVVGFASSSDNLLALVQRLNPEVVIIDMQSPGRDTLESLESIKSAAPKPIVMFTQDDAGESIIRATRAGVSAYVVDGISKKRVRPILDAAVERFQQFRTLTTELERTRAQLEEHKIIDKAKGILMKQRQLTEEDAYKALRNQAMRSNKRVFDVAESVVAAASLLI